MPSSYRVLVHFDPERSVFVARAPELEHCSAEGATRAEAVAKLEEEITAQLENIREHGGAPPAALDDDLAAHSGEIAARVSRGLHRDLVWQARVEGVDLGQLLGELLAQGLEARRQARRRPSPNSQPAAQAAPVGDEGGGRDPRPERDRRQGGYAGGGGRGRNDGRYHAIMEDKATFLEYVRQLESGGPQGGGRRGGGGGRRGGGGRGQGGAGGGGSSDG